MCKGEIRKKNWTLLQFPGIDGCLTATAEGVVKTRNHPGIQHVFNVNIYLCTSTVFVNVTGKGIKIGF